VRVELIPSARDRELVEQARMGDPIATQMVEEIPAEVREHLEQGRTIPLGTDPDEGSFVYHLAARRGAGEELGHSLLDRCHIAGTSVLVKRDGVIRQVAIEDLDPDTDLVLSHAGVWREFEVGSRPVSEEIVVLHVSKIEQPVSCTKDHRYPVFRDGHVVEIPARDIQSGDYLQVAQVPISCSSPDSSALAEFVRGIDTTEFGYFLGFWLGDGHITKQDGSLRFTYNFNDPVSVRSVQEQIKPMLNALKVVWSECTRGGSAHLDICQNAFVQWMSASFGHTHADKHLPPWIFDIGKNCLYGLLRGFCDSSGNVTRRKDGSVSVWFNSTNATLMEQIFLLCTSLGIPASKTTRVNGKVSSGRPVHVIYFTHSPSVKVFFESGFLAKRQDPDMWKDGRSGSRFIVHDGKLFYRVQSVSLAMYAGPVYSLNVHEDHSFFSGSLRTCNCLRVLYYREKLRQAQTQIASRAMTPKRIVWADGLSEADTEQLRDQVDLALVDPDYSIVTNYEIHWEEMGSRDRLLDLSTEYEQTERQLLAGLGVTESLMSGEAIYSGDRLKLEVINTRYLFLREVLQEYVEKYLFRPVAIRKGFVEKDEWGQDVVLYPRLSFTRLPLRDSQDTFDALLNLYQKGSVSIDVILEMFNIDPVDTREKIERDMFTVNDSTFNEVIRSLYSEAGRVIVEKTDIVDRIARYLGIKMIQESQDESRF
jgi:hypothetical protein